MKFKTVKAITSKNFNITSKKKYINQIQIELSEIKEIINSSIEATFHQCNNIKLCDENSNGIKTSMMCGEIKLSR